MSQTQTSEVNQNHKTVSKGFTAEESREARELYQISTNYIQLADKSMSPPKPMHIFYTHFLQALRYEESNDIPLAAMKFAPSSPTGVLVVNPRNVKNLNLRSYSGLIVHELMHLMYDHLHAAELKQWPKLSNIAMDMSINQLVLKDRYLLPSGTNIMEDNPELEINPCLPESVAKQLDVPAPPLNQDWQFYLRWLIKVVEDKEKNQEEPDCSSCGGSGQSSSGESGQSPNDSLNDTQSEQDKDSSGKDDESCSDCNGSGKQSIQDLIDELNGNTSHELWEDFNELSPEQQEIVKRYVAQAALEAARSSGGEQSLPGSIQGAYSKLIKCLEPQVDWTAHVREFAGSCGKLSPYVRKNRLNKHGFPGKLSFKPGGCVGCVIDTSGSVTDGEYGVFLAELIALSRDYELEVLVQETSYGVTAEMWKLSDEGIQNFYSRNGYGGTNMRPGIDAFLEQIDDKDEDAMVGGIIVFSDGELADDSIITPEELAPYDIPLLWVFSRKTSKPFSNKRVAGEVIYFEKNIERRF